MLCVLCVLCLLSGLCALGDDEQQARSVSDARGVETGGPLAARDRREPILRRGARQLAAQRVFELRDDLREGHGTMVIDEQLFCGAG